MAEEFASLCLTMLLKYFPKTRVTKQIKFILENANALSLKHSFEGDYGLAGFLSNTSKISDGEMDALQLAVLSCSSAGHLRCFGGGHLIHEP